MVRSFRRKGRKHDGTGSSRLRHDHARCPSGNTAIASFDRAADPQVADLHPRIPVILTADEMLPWLGREMPDEEAIERLGTGWTGRYITRRVRPFGIADDGPELIEAEGLDL
ncbi:hypothetical protein [Defluviimonas sp. SAOS-178_SWC]|uniref:hypothetical protein n=1 Tax=Defluviimonas sp. SAOS-178_SWC TaxID=3121287 RepID=UPI003221525D